jgi:hypothetical protein
MAEVKVKITAANQTQTGFQSVLADAQKTATQVQQTFARASTAPRMPQVKQPGGSGGPIDIDIGDYGLGPLRELQEQLKKARESAQQAFDPAPAEEFGGGIARSAGRMTLLVAGAAAVGKIVASAFDQLSTAVKSAIGIQEQFNQTLSQAGRATSLSGAISEFTQLSNAAKQTGKVIAETFGKNIGEAIANALQGRPGQLMARLADLSTGGAVRGELEAGQEQQRRIARENTMANMAQLDLQAFEMVGAGGDPAEVASIKREQEKRREIEDLRAGLQGSDPAFINQQVSELEGIQAMQDQMSAQAREFAANQQTAATTAQTAQIGMTPKERLAQEQANQTRLQGEIVGASQGAQSMAEMQGLADLEGFVGPEVEAQKEAAIGRIMALQQQIQGQGQGALVGSMGASSLQRIGFASNEFFDTRRREDPNKEAKRAADAAKNIYDLLKKAEPLVLAPSN